LPQARSLILASEFSSFSCRLLSCHDADLVWFRIGEGAVLKLQSLCRISPRPGYWCLRRTESTFRDTARRRCGGKVVPG
jgi:hypothetical protein